MPLIRRTLRPQQRSRRRLPWLGGTSTASDVSVSPERSLQIGAVYSCVRLLSEAVASLPVGMFERRDDSRVPVVDHPLLRLVRDNPNPVIDAGELWRTVLGWMLLRGNAYVFVERDGAGRPIGLWPIAPTSVEVQRLDTGQLVYDVMLGDAEYAPISGRRVRAESMLHYRAFGLGVEGFSPIGLARQSVGIAFAAQQYVGGFFARDASPGMTISVPDELTDDQAERLEAQWRNLHEGFERAHQLAVLEGGAEVKPYTLSPADAQFIETQKFSRSEIASIYGVPPHMIGDTEKSTSWGSGIEAQGIGFVTYSLRPWLNRLERVTRKLISEPAYRLRWNVDGLMEGDTQSRYNAYATAKQWGWMSTNDIRRKEDDEPVDGGDDYLQPLNMVPAGSTTAPAQRTVRYLPDEYEVRVGSQHREVRAQKPPAAEHSSWVSRHRDVLAGALADQRDEVLDSLHNGAPTLDRDHWDRQLGSLLFTPSFDLTSEVGQRTAAELGGGFTAAWTRAYLRASSNRQARNVNISTQDAIDRAAQSAADADEPVADHVNAAFDEATHTRAGLVATAMVNATGNFARHEGAQQAGALSKTWRTTSGNPRSSHAAMEGETVNIDDLFSNGANYPHDPDAGVDEVAGCECIVEFSTEEP
jgi:HK97 family phage portal protein